MGNIKKKFSTTRNKVIAICAVVILAVVIVAAFSLSNARNARADASPAVSAITEKGSIAETVVGTGNLANKTADEVEVPVGVEVEEVLVEEGDEVQVGTPLARVTELSVKENMLEIQEALDALDEEIDNLDEDDDNYSLTYDIKVAEEADLEQTLADMEALLEDLTITSTYEGVIETIYLADNTVIEKNVVTSDTSTSDTTETTDIDSSAISGMTGISSKSTDQGVKAMTLSTPSEVKTDEGIAAMEKASPTEPTKVYGSISLSIAAPVKDKDAQTSPEIKSGSGFSGTISWNPAAATFAAGTQYTATVYLTADKGHAFSSDKNQLDIVVDSYGNPDFELKDLDGDGYVDTILFTMAYPATETADIPAEATDPTTGIAPSGSSSASGDMSGTGSTGTAASGLTGSDASDSVDAVDSAQYDAYKTVGVTVIPKDQMILNVEVDELDILSVSEGQNADIELDAVSEEVFSGTITGIASDAASSGGVSKYNVEITLTKVDLMKSGMSASATILVNETADTLLIPMEALQEVDGKTFVYTSVDEDDQTLSSPVDVKTGLSNSDSVEIVSGLKEGTEVFYNEKVTETAEPLEGMMQNRDSADESNQETGSQDGEEE